MKPNTYITYLLLTLTMNHTLDCPNPATSTYICLDGVWQAGGGSVSRFPCRAQASIDACLLLLRSRY